MTGPPRRDAESAISSVLGAILLFGLFVVTMVSIQVQFVPRWEEDREARHMDQVVDQLGVFKADAGRLVTNATQGGITDPLTLGTTEGFRFFRSSAVARPEVDFTPSDSGSGVLVSSPLLRIQVRDGEELFGLEEDWTAIPSTGNVSDINKVRHLRVRVNTTDLGQSDDNSSSTLSVYDANGAFAGKAIVTYRWESGEESLRTVTYNAGNGTISSGVEAFFQQTTLDHMYIDLLDSELLFRDVLAAAAKPLQLRLTNDGLDADYTVVFTDSAGGSGGSTGGLLVPNYSSTLVSGSLALRTGYQHLPDQTFVLEHGGVIVVQSDGAAMLVPPALVVSAGVQQVAFDLVVPGFDGSAAGLAGDRSLTLAAHATGEATRIEAVAARISLTLPTAYPDVWADYLDDVLTNAGLSGTGSDPQYNVTTSTDSVQLDLFGPVSAPGDTTEDVFLRYQQATLGLEIIPSG